MTPPLVKRYFIAFDRHKWAGLAGFAFVVGASGLVALQPEKPPSYVAEGTLAHNRPPVTLSTTGTQIQEQGQVLSPQILLADNVVQPAAQQADMPASRLRNRVILNVEQEGNARNQTLQVTVRYEGGNPEQTSAVVNTLMQGMVEQSRLINTARLRAIIETLTERLPQVTQELRVAEQNLEQYDRQEGPALLAAQNGNLVSSISASEQQQRQLQMTLEGVEAQIRSIQAKLGLNPEQAYASSALSADPILANLRSQIYQNESQMAILSQDLRPEHPTMVELNRRQIAYEQLLQQRANEVIGGNEVAAPLIAGLQIRRDSSLDPARQQLANTLVGLETQRDTLRQQLASTVRSEQQLRQQYAAIPNKQLERSRLEQQVVLKRALYDKMQVALVDAQAAEAETVSSLSLAKPAQIIATVQPGQSAPLTLGVGIILGLLVGSGVILLLNSLEGKFYTLEEIREALRQREVPILGVLPLVVPSQPNPEALPIILEGDSPYLEFYERFRSNLRRAEGKTVKVVLFTSTLDEEGKSVSAYNLAIASARAGRRTLLIEADLRSPSQAKALRVAADPESLIEPLRYYSQLSDCIRLVPEVENLYIVPSPGPQRQAAAILESSEIRRLLEDVRGRFDLVILDTASLSRCNDALLLEPYSDGVVMVTRPGYTEDNLLAEVVEQMSESEDIRLLGAIINGADIPVNYPPRRTFLDSDSDLEKMETRNELEEVSVGARD